MSVPLYEWANIERIMLPYFEKLDRGELSKGEVEKIYNNIMEELKSKHKNNSDAESDNYKQDMIKKRNEIIHDMYEENYTISQLEIIFNLNSNKVKEIIKLREKEIAEFSRLLKVALSLKEKGFFENL